MIALANGREVPRVAVNALADFEQIWPGATLPLARAAVVAAILDALRERYAIVALPGPDSDRYGGEEPADRPAWLYDIGLYEVSMWHTGEVQVGYNGEPGEPLSVDEARRLAVALLAAADAAERDQ